MSVLYLLYFCIFSMCMEKVILSKVQSNKNIIINQILLQIVSYEIILERIENAFKDDKFVTFEGLRVKKFNRTM